VPFNWRLSRTLNWKWNCDKFHGGVGEEVDEAGSELIAEGSQRYLMLGTVKKCDPTAAREDPPL